jgi:hypothetical protein
MAKLTIKFRCLCFFVRDPEYGQMHVVTPATCGCGGNGEKHEAFLVFPKAGGRLNAAGNIRADGEEGKVDFVEMEDYAIVLPSNGAPADLDLGPSTVDLNAVAGGGVDPALVRGPRDKRITSRITLPSGRIASSAVPGTWNFDGQEKIGMARDVFWTIDGLPDEPLVVRRSRFAMGEDPNPEEDEVVAEITPNSRGEFRLEFHHSLEGDFGRPLETIDPNAAARHFLSYYDLYDAPAKKPVPAFVSSPDVGVVGCLDARGTVTGG